MGKSEDYNPLDYNAVIARIDGNVQTLVDGQHELRQKHAEIEARLTTLERWRFYLLGVFAAAGLGVKAAWELFWKQ